MQLVERHIIKKNNTHYKGCDNLCFLSKNLYNAGLYRIKQEFLETGKWLRYNELEKEFKLNNQLDYRHDIFPVNSSQQTLMLLDKNLKSYFSAIKSWKRDNKKFTGCPKFPKYLDKEKGMSVIFFTNVQFRIKGNLILFPKKSGLPFLKTKVTEKILQVRIIPKLDYYIIEVVYNYQEKIKESLNQNYLSIDLGINNLATCVDTKNNKFICNGKPVKSINQFYNKKLAKLKSSLQIRHNRKSSNKTRKLSLKRNNKITDYLHKSSRYIINHCIKNDIDNIVIGKNTGWKDSVNIGKRNNQNFVSIPFNTFESYLYYKAQKEGIRCITREESYTSKCSALDLEPIQKQDIYLGKRVKRGLFKSSKGITINADINGSLNIMRKEVGDEVLNNFLTNRGLVVSPLKVNF